MTRDASHATSCESEGRIPIRRSGVYLRPDNSRMLLRPFLPEGDIRGREIVRRILQLAPVEVEAGLDQVRRSLTHQHAGIEVIFANRCRELCHLLPLGADPSPSQRLLIGAYFMCEYSLQSAALFNPSIVPHPDQTEIPPGSMRFVMSLRATGEGHLSSIEFRSGLVNADGNLVFDPVSGSVIMPEIRYPPHRKSDFAESLVDLGFDEAFIGAALDPLAQEFEPEELEEFLHHPDRWPHWAGMSTTEDDPQRQSVRDAIRWVAHSDYLVEFPKSLALSERVIFPVSPSERNGIEDARFVRFQENDGTHRYYATYTAFDGTRILPQLIETEDFHRFRLRPLHGASAQNKGMALFPRRIGGRYAMLGRQGGACITIMFSDNVYRWEEHEILLEPKAPWEFVQLGNCGSPLETEAGWLVLTHGVGAMRNYCIGAALLDRDDPRRVIGRLREPLLEPLDHERDGYVPNVVYSCGSQIHNGWLVIPYAVSDYATTTACVEIGQLLEWLVDQRT